jgi:hypothetical protein
MSFSEELQSTWNIELARRLLRRASLDPRLWRKKASATAFRRCGEEIESHMPVRSSGRHRLAARHPTCKRRHRLAARHQLAMERLLRSYLDLYVTTTPVSPAHRARAPNRSASRASASQRQRTGQRTGRSVRRPRMRTPQRRRALGSLIGAHDGAAPKAGKKWGPGGGDQQSTSVQRPKRARLPLVSARLLSLCSRILGRLVGRAR